MNFGTKRQKMANKYFMIVTENNWLEVWSVGYSSKDKAQERVNTKYHQKFMYDADKSKDLVVITHQEHIEFKQKLKKSKQ